MKTTELIKAASIARVTSKETGKFLGFLVKSNHSEDYYQVTCSKIAGECVWACTCKAAEFGFHNCEQHTCCHIKACQQLCEARKALTKAAPLVAPEQGVPLANAAFTAQAIAWHKREIVKEFEEKVAKATKRKIVKDATVKRAPQFAGFVAPIVNDTHAFSFMR